MKFEKGLYCWLVEFGMNKKYYKIHCNEGSGSEFYTRKEAQKIVDELNRRRCDGNKIGE
jgi:hypothetical protein